VDDCNGGIAFRHLVPGEGTRVPDEATAFHFEPLGSKRFSEVLPLKLKELWRNDRLVPSGKGGKPIKANHPTSQWLHEGGGSSSGR